MCSLGVMFGAFSRNLTELYLTVGFLNGRCLDKHTHNMEHLLKNVKAFVMFAGLSSLGFGYALTWTPTVTMLSLYFDKRRPVANALASAGECILTFVLTPLFQLLIDSYSWRGALLILGGLQLHLCVCGMLLRPLKALKSDTCEVQAEEEGLFWELPSNDNSEFSKSNHLEAEELRIPERPSQRKINVQLEDPKEIPNSTKTLKASRRMRTVRTKILRYVDYTLITNPQFMIYAMFGVFAALGFFAPALFLVPYARSKGIEEYQAAALMSISAALDLFGRVLFGWLANYRLVKTVRVLVIVYILHRYFCLKNIFYFIPQAGNTDKSPIYRQASHICTHDFC